MGQYDRLSEDRVTNFDIGVGYGAVFASTITTLYWLYSSIRGFGSPDLDVKLAATSVNIIGMLALSAETGSLLMRKEAQSKSSNNNL